MIRAVCLAAALTRGLPLAGTALEADHDPALLRLAEQSGCSGRTGPVGQATAGPIVDAVDGAVGEQWICHQGAWLVRVHH